MKAALPFVLGFVALALWSGCSVAPISLSGLDKNAYLTDQARIDKLVGGERACLMAQAALCAYDVEQHMSAPEGKLDSSFCLGLSGFAPLEAYGTPKPEIAPTRAAWVTAGPRGPLMRMQVPDHGKKPRDAAFVARKGEDIIIAFRGTVPGFYEAAFAADWANNAEFDLVPDKDLADVEIHKGFRDSLANTFSDVVKYVERLLQGSKGVKGIYLTGHSKGGALAYIAALKLRRLNPALPIKGVYTFAAPRPGGEKFSRSYESAFAGVPTWRYEHRADFIPHLVPQEAEADSLREYLALVGRHKLPIGRYRSVGMLVFINADEGLVLQIDPRESKLAELRARSITLGGTLSAHKMERYLERTCKRAPFAR